MDRPEIKMLEGFEIEKKIILCKNYHELM